MKGKDHVTANPPNGASLLFSATSEKGQIKRRKNGHYRMKLDGVESID